VHVLLAAVGTRGDVQPALALALELRKLGCAVRLCISPNFVDWANGLGLEAVPMGVEMRMPRKSGAMPTLTPEELRRMRESMPDLITDQFEPLAPPRMAVMSSSAPTRISMQRRRSPNTQALAA
jgi:vancomycin aglycone glucosyltransferase